MTSATERLREMLDERGVEWSGFWVKTMQATQFRHGGIGWTVTEHPSGKLYLTSTSITPEQAIAATLGSDVHAGRFAEILHDLAEEMRNIGASSMTPHELLIFFAREIDKVADSLVFAATLGSGECELEPLSALDVTLNMLNVGEWGACSACGYATPLDSKYCAECGRAVKR